MKKLFIFLICFIFCGLSFSFAQLRMITGNVTLDSGDGLEGVSVTIKGSDRGTNSNFNGDWVLSASDDEILVISFIGLKSREIPIGDKKFILTVLEPEVHTFIEDVLVTAYGVQKEASLTGSVAIVDGKVLSNVAVAGLDQMLQGKNAGVDVVASSGNPGAQAKILIRGASSISASTSPLYIVDGIPVNSGLNSISADDVESISTLKDASAVALYGARASNGVILITTKKGKEGHMKVNYSNSFGSTYAILNNYNQMNTSELLKFQQECLGAGSGFDASSEQYAILSAIDTDWRDEILQKGSVQMHNISLNGGTDKSHFYLAANNYDENGVVKEVYFKRKGVAFNADMQGTQWLTVGVNVNIQSSESRRARVSRNALNPFYFVYAGLPFEKMYNDDGTFNRTSFNVNPLENTISNPLITKNTNFISSVWSDIKFNDNFKLVTRAGFTRYYTETESFTRKGSQIAEVLGANGKSESYNRYSTSIFNSILSYTNVFEEKHALKAKAIFESQLYDSRVASMYGKNFPSASLNNLASSSDASEASSAVQEWALLSYMLDFKYSFDSKYIADFSLRRDGSSRFANDYRYGNFWALGFAWNAHREAFLSDYDNINSLKLRASIGTSGNIPNSLYGFISSVDYSLSYNNLPAGELANIGNSQLKWEKILQASLGIDFSVFDNRLSGSIDFYQKKTSDLLLNSQLSRTTGFTSIIKNVGELTNTGFEFSLNTVPVKTDKFEWGLGFNLFKNNSVIDKLDGEDIISGYNILREGEKMYSYYMVRYAGVNAATGEALYYTKDGKVTDTYSDSDRVVLDKSPFPILSGAFNSDIVYSNFSLGMNFYFKYGNYIYNNAAAASHRPGAFNTNLNRDLITQSWTKVGDNAVYPNCNSSAELSSSTLFLENASYLRLRDISLSYSIPASVLKKLYVEKLKFSVKAHNLWTYAPGFTGPDPEVGDGGESQISSFGTVYDYSYPTSSSYTFGLELTF